MKYYLFFILIIICNSTVCGQLDFDKVDSASLEVSEQNYRVQSAYKNSCVRDFNKYDKGKLYFKLCGLIAFPAVIGLVSGPAILFYDSRRTKADMITGNALLSIGILCTAIDIPLYLHWKDEIKYFIACRKKL